MDKEYSGVSWYTLNLLQNILRRDQDNEYIFYYNSYKDIRKRLPELEKSELVRTGWPNKFFNYGLQKIFSYPQIDRLLGVDVFFSPHINFTSLSGDVKKVLTIHDLSFLRHPEFFSWRKNFWHRMVNAGKMIKKADVVVAVSKNTKDDIREFLHIPEEKIKVVYPGIGPEFNKKDATDPRLAEVKNKYRLPRKFVLFLGAFEPRKNLEGALRAFDRAFELGYMKDYGFVAAGSKGWKNKEAALALKQIKQKRKVSSIGYVDNEDKPYLYNLASFFIYPSFYEGFGFPPLEAMACGTPVITSPNSSLLESAGNAAIMADPNNIESMARAMSELAADPDLRGRLSEKGLIRSKRFNWHKTADDYIKIFNS